MPVLGFHTALYIALQEIGKIERALFMLDWPENPLYAAAARPGSTRASNAIPWILLTMQIWSRRNERCPARGKAARRWGILSKRGLCPTNREWTMSPVGGFMCSPSSACRRCLVCSVRLIARAMMRTRDKSAVVRRLPSLAASTRGSTVVGFICRTSPATEQICAVSRSAYARDRRRSRRSRSCRSGNNR